MQIDYTAPPRGELPPETARPYLIAEYGHRCFRCGLKPSDERPKMDVDHIIPVARGGGNFYGNYQFLCGPCNSWKHTQIIDFRPGERRKIEAGLPIIPNEDRVRKSSVKAVIVAPAPLAPFAELAAVRALSPAVLKSMRVAMDSGDRDAIEAAQELVASQLTAEIGIEIRLNPAKAAQRLLGDVIAMSSRNIESAYQFRQTIELFDRAEAGWSEALDLTNVESVTIECIEVSKRYRATLGMLTSREQTMALMTLYSIAVTVAAVWFWLS